MLTHIPISDPTARLVPIRMPTPMPTTKDSAIPIRNACSVILAASANVDDETTSGNAASTSVNGGSSDTSSSRPTTSQMREPHQQRERHRDPVTAQLHVTSPGSRWSSCQICSTQSR